MSLLQNLKDANLAARKARDNFRASLLNTMYSDASNVGKNDGQRESTDDEVLRVIRKFENNLKGNVAIFTERNMTKELEEAKLELAIISEFLPAMLSDEQVRNDITEVIAAKNLPLVQKSQGAVIAALKAKYGSQFIGDQVATQFRIVANITK